jgi:hypothetical protein
MSHIDILPDRPIHEFSAHVPRALHKSRPVSSAITLTERRSRKSEALPHTPPKDQRPLLKEENLEVKFEIPAKLSVTRGDM